jgi:hypothetical protein
VDTHLEASNERNRPIPHPDLVVGHIERLGLQSSLASGDEDDPAVDEPAAGIKEIVTAAKLKYAVLLPRINECLARKCCSVKTLELYVEEQFRRVYDLIPAIDLNWTPAIDVYGRQPGNKSIVMQPPTDDREKTLRYGDVVVMPLLVQ